MQDFERGVNRNLYRRNRIFSQPGNFLSLPAERKLRLAKEVPLSLTFEILHLSGFLRLEQNQKTTKRLFENLSERVCG